MPSTSPPMATRIPKGLKARLKSQAEHPEYGTLRALITVLLKNFLQAKPYMNSSFRWLIQASKTENDWTHFNVIVDKDMQRKLKDECIKREISLSVFLFNGIHYGLDELSRDTDKLHEQGEIMTEEMTIRIILKKANTDAQGTVISDEYKTVEIASKELEKILLGNTDFESFSVVGAELIDREKSEKRRNLELGW